MFYYYYLIDPHSSFLMKLLAQCSALVILNVVFVFSHLSNCSSYLPEKLVQLSVRYFWFRHGTNLNTQFMDQYIEHYNI